jgi:hypothetical protein
MCFKHSQMLTLQFWQTFCTELQFIAVVSEVEQYSGILSAIPIISRLSVIPTVVIYQ